MCVTFTRRNAGPGFNADGAAAFAGAAVISALSMADWQICADVEAAMSSAVAALASAPTEVTVTLHHEWIDIVAAAHEEMTRRRCVPRRPFRTVIECDDSPQVATPVTNDHHASADFISA